MEVPRNVKATGQPEAGVVASSVYAAGHRVADIAIEEAGQWTSKDGHVVWIGLLEPGRDLLLRVQRQFQLHDLAIEDAEHPHQRPKLEQYGDALFIVARTAQLIEGRVTFGETHLFVGTGYIVSVRHGPSTSYTAVRQHWESPLPHSRKARTSSSTPSSTSSSTTTCPYSSRSRTRWTPSRTGCWCVR